MAVLFNGTNQAITTGSGDVLRNSTAATIMAWVKVVALPAGQGTMYQVMINTAANASRAIIHVNSTGTIQLNGRAPDTVVLSGITSTPTISTGAWHHIAGTLDYTNKVGVIYIDGVAVASTGTLMFTANQTDNTTSIGSTIGAADANTSLNLNAHLEDLRVYSRLLDADEIATIYASNGKDDIYFGLNARYALKGPAAGTATTNPDETPTELPGTGQNSPTFSDSPLSKRGSR